MKDETFSNKDIVRLARYNLTNREYDLVIEELCQGGESEEKKNNEKDIKNIKNEIDLTVNPDGGIWGEVVGFIGGLLASEKEEREEDARIRESELQAFRAYLLDFDKNMIEYAPSHGRNRKAYLRHLEELRIQTEIIRPCLAVSDKYIKIQREYWRLEDLNAELMKNINNLFTEIGEYFDF